MFTTYHFGEDKSTHTIDSWDMTDVLLATKLACRLHDNLCNTRRSLTFSIYI